MLEWNVRVPRPGRLKHSIPAATLLLEIGQLGLRDSFRDLHPSLWRDLFWVLLKAAWFAKPIPLGVDRWPNSFWCL